MEFNNNIVSRQADAEWEGGGVQNEINVQTNLNTTANLPWSKLILKCACPHCKF